MFPRFLHKSCIAATLLAATSSAVIHAQSASSSHPAPRIVEKEGRHALMVDGSPYLVLGGQINNSSSWPSMLPEVWPALEHMGANTVEAPVYWEQMEAKEGSFDFSVVDMLVQQARQHGLHLILLWFGTWKNGNMHYTPEWVKTNTSRFPRVINAAGDPIDVLSAHGLATLAADKAAFTALMQHLAQIDDREHTVLMVQVENESGIVGSPRDFSPAATRALDGPVPRDVLSALHLAQAGTWREVFHGRADETYQAYAQARYVNEIAAAGKKAFNIPLYCNVWLSYPEAVLPERQLPNPGIGYPSGGPVQDMLPLWKALAPAIDVIGPDIYSDDATFALSVFKTYQRTDNPLWIPESGNSDGYAALMFLALGHGAIGFSPFGIDRAGRSPSGQEAAKAHVQNFWLLGPMSRELAKLNFEGKLQTAVEATGSTQQELSFGAWHADVRFGFPQHDGGGPPGTSDKSGRALIAQLASDEFLLTGIDCSIVFHLPGQRPGHRMQILSAKEGSYTQGVWHTSRLLNGDQTDRGLIFRQDPETVVRIRVGTF